MRTKNKSILLKIIGGSSVLIISFIITILICILMLLDFLGANITKDKIENNIEYSEDYKKTLNNNIRNGYVPLQRILYFYLEDSSFTIDTLYKINQNIDTKTSEKIEIVCNDERLKNMNACDEFNIKENEDYLKVSTGKFNFPLDVSIYTITSFFNEQRIIYGESNVHSGWDLSVQEQTPVYSVCSGIVDKITFTQTENVPYDQSGNSVGNVITIKCDEDYDENFYVIFAHLYPNSSKVNVGDRVNHWTEIASVGTTGHSTGNHLHYEVQDENRNKIDGMNLIDFTMKRE